jgi:hypothetical protein
MGTTAYFARDVSYLRKVVIKLTKDVLIGQKIGSEV